MPKADFTHFTYKNVSRRVCVNKNCLPTSPPQAYDTGTNSSALDYGVTRLNLDLQPVQGILVELLLTFLLVTVFLLTTVERTEMRPVAPVLIGLALTAAIIARYVYIYILYDSGSKKCNPKNLMVVVTLMILVVVIFTCALQVF